MRAFWQLASDAQLKQMCSGLLEGWSLYASGPIPDSARLLLRQITNRLGGGDPFVLGPLPPRYHILALVHLVGEGQEVHLDHSRVFLVPKAIVESRAIRSFNDVEDFRLRADLVAALFA